MDRNDDLTPADHEREARALGSVIRNFEKLRSLGNAPADQTQDASDNPEDRRDADDPDAVRRALAQRIERLRERLPPKD